MGEAGNRFPFLNNMNKAAKIVSDAILGNSVRFCTVGGKVYTLVPPSIATILTAVSHLSRFGLEKEKYTLVEITGEYERNIKPLTVALAVLICGKDGIKARWTARKLRQGTFKELLEMFSIFIGMMGGNDFFALASLAKSMQKMAAAPK